MQEKLKINIIGAGISGLSAGSYLQMNGFETQIFEKHSIPGGLCTSWKNGEYTIDGSIHWILGSNKGSGFYKTDSRAATVKKSDKPAVKSESKPEIKAEKKLPPKNKD